MALGRRGGCKSARALVIFIDHEKEDKDARIIIILAGWWLAEKNIAQISLNLTDMDVNVSHIFH